MAAFSPFDAALEGFRITREHPRALLSWTVLALAASVVSVLVVAGLPDARAAIEALRSEQMPDLVAIERGLGALILLAALSLAVQCMTAAAVYRIMLRPEDARLGYLRLGGDEARLLALTFIYVFIAVGLIFLAALFVGLTAAATYRAGLAVPAGTAAYVFALGLLVYVAVRLSLAPVITFAEHRLAVFDSWRLTRGQFWRLLGTYILALCCIVVVVLLALIIFLAVVAAFVVGGGGELAEVSRMITPDDTSLASYLSVPVILYTVFSALLGALYYAVVFSPAVVAYQALVDRASDFDPGPDDLADGG